MYLITYVIIFLFSFSLNFSLLLNLESDPGVCYFSSLQKCCQTTINSGVSEKGTDVTVNSVDVETLYYGTDNNGMIS